MGPEEGAFFIITPICQFRVAVQAKHVGDLLLTLFSVNPQKAFHPSSTQLSVQQRGAMNRR